MCDIFFSVNTGATVCVCMCSVSTLNTEREMKKGPYRLIARNRHFIGLLELNCVLLLHKCIVRSTLSFLAQNSALQNAIFCTKRIHIYRADTFRVICWNSLGHTTTDRRHDEYVYIDWNNVINLCANTMYFL